MDSLKQGQDDQIRRIAALEQASSETIRTLTEIRERMSGVESAVRAGFEATNKRLDDFRPVHP